MSADSYFYENEEIQILRNNERIKTFLEDFYEMAGIGFSHIFEVFGIPQDDYFKQLNFVRYFLITKNKKHLNLFYEMLKNSGYDMRTEIIFFTNLIASSRSVSSMDSNIEYANMCPIIDRVEKNDDGIHINSSYGSPIFDSIFRKFQEGEIADYIHKFDLSKNCHNVTWELMEKMNQADLIVSLINNSFFLQYYHSYLGVNEDIVDITNGIFSKKGHYDELYKPKEILVLDSKKCEQSYTEAIESGLFQETKIQPKSLIIALHQEMKVM